MTLQELFRIFRNQVTKSGPAPPIHFLQNFSLSLSLSHTHARTTQMLTHTHTYTHVHTHTHARTRTPTLSLSLRFIHWQPSPICHRSCPLKTAKRAAVCVSCLKKWPKELQKGKKRKKGGSFFISMWLRSFKLKFNMKTWSGTVPGSPLKRLIIFKRPGFQLNWISPGEA